MFTVYFLTEGKGVMNTGALSPVPDSFWDLVIFLASEVEMIFVHFRSYSKSLTLYNTALFILGFILIYDNMIRLHLIEWKYDLPLGLKEKRGQFLSRIAFPFGYNIV